jgi:CheY-like chemotaxis protein
MLRDFVQASTIQASKQFLVSFSSQFLPFGERNSHGGVHLGDHSFLESERKPRALVVDDVPDVTEMLSVFLTHAGYEVVTTESAAAAFELAKAGQFDVVVSDIGMPRMNGYELVQALRTLPGYNSVPMIAVTGFSMYDDQDRSIHSGFSAHLTKPIDPLALLELIERLRD